MSQQGINIAAFAFHILQEARQQILRLGAIQPKTYRGRVDLLLGRLLEKANDHVKDDFSKILIGRHPGLPGGCIADSKAAAAAYLGVDQPLPGEPTMGPPGLPWPPAEATPNSHAANEMRTGPSPVGVWVVACTPSCELLKWGRSGDTGEPYPTTEAALRQAEALAGSPRHKDDTFYFLNVFSNGQIRTDECL